MMQPRPITPRKAIQLLVALTILAWATQTLFHQWGFGAEIEPPAIAPESLSEIPIEPTTAPPASAPAKSELPSDSPAADAAPAEPALVELRVEATTDASEVTLKQLCRFSDDSSLAAHGKLVIAMLDTAHPVRQIGVAEIKAALHDAGVNLAEIQFSGAASCAVRKNDVDDATFAKLIAQDGDNQQTADADDSALQSNAEPAGPAAAADASQTPLFAILQNDLLKKLDLPPGAMEVRFDVSAQPVLMMTAPSCSFDIDAQHASSLGDISWEVTIQSPAGERKATIVANAFAWQEQLELNRPLSAGQKLLAGDLAFNRVPVTKLGEQQLLLDARQVIGQVLTRNMKRGDVLVVGSVKSEPLIIKDQFVTVSMPVNGIMVETVARAMESGARGEVVKAKNEATGQVYDIIVTASAAGELTSSAHD